MAEVRTDDIELSLVELESREGGHIGGMQIDDGALMPGQEISEGMAIEQGFVQQLSKDMRPTEIRRPESKPVGRRAEDSGTKFALPIFPEKVSLEIPEDAVTVERVIHRGETPTRNSIDDIQLINQSFLTSLPGDRSSCQLLQYAVGEGGRACTAT